MKLGGITKRWIINTFGVILSVLLVVSAAVIVTARQNYYSSVRQKLESTTSDVVNTFFSLYGGTAEDILTQGGREFIENFEGKDKMGVWILDASGKVLLSSSGFEHEKIYQMPDFNEALGSRTGESKPMSLKLDSGERVMAATVALTQSEGKIVGAVRYMISLEEIDAQLWMIVFLVILSCLLVALLVLLSGSFFIRSIVWPIQNISVTAQRIASGDLQARISQYYYDDELGALCETINHMAEELETADRIKNDFISTVSHELRTPLTAIKGWGETLLQLGDTDEISSKRGINVIINESTRLSGIVEELLDFSRMQSGRLKMKVERIDVLAELDEIVFTMKERAIREGIEMVYNVPHFPIPMEGDANRIRQVFVNILDNAIKYNEPGGKIIIIAEVKSETSLEIAISDTGRGIATEDLPRVKEKFYKADAAVRGAGIGLAVADEIVKLHGGELSVDSIYGSGTTVALLFQTEKITIPDEGIPEEGETPHEQTEN